MRFAVVVAALLAVVMLGPATTADVLQLGIDAARTGVAPDAGPKLDEVAWAIQLPGSVSRNPPLVIGDQAYIVTSDLRHREDLDQNAIWQVSMVDGSATPIIKLDDAGSSQLGGAIGGQTVRPGRVGFPQATATDGARFSVAGPERVVVYDLASGAEQWQWTYPVLTVEQEMVYCAPPALTGRLLVLGCTAFGEPPDELGDHGDQVAQLVQFVAALDLETEQEAWVWVRDPASLALNEDTPANPTCTPLAFGGTCGLPSTAPLIVGVSTFGPIIVSSIVSVLERPSGAEYKALIGLNLEGELEWIKQTTQDTSAPDGEGFIQFSVWATGDNADGYLAFRDLLHVNPATGAVVDAYNLEPRDELSPEPATTFALTEDRLFFTTARNIIAVDRYDFTRAEYWVEPLPPRSTGAWGYEPLTYADGVVYGRVTDGYQSALPAGAPAAVSGENTSRFQAYDALTGDLLWSHTLVADFWPLAFPLHGYTVAAGLMLVAGQDGRVVAIGRTGASLQPDVTVSDLYPAIGATVTLDASGTQASSWPGANASTAPAGFRADWGDGTTTDWQPDPTFSHAYNEKGDRQAVLYVRNDAGQQSAEAFTFHVGGTPPPEPNALMVFIDENPDATWGIFGLIVVLLGAALTSYRIAKRRGLMARELAAIDAAAEEAGVSSTRLRAAMDERRARAHGLLLDHRIDESQYQILGRRIDEAGRANRMHELRALFDFLPFAMVRALEQMLEDGQITSVERRGIQALLNDNEVLTKAQKRKVAALVDDWFAQDEGAGA